VVVDNGGRATVTENDRRSVLSPARNDGFGAGANAGMAAARRLGALTVVLLNDDVVVTDGWLDPLVSELRADPDVGAVQPMLVLDGGEVRLVNSLGVMIGPDGAGNDIGLGMRVSEVDTATHDIELFTGGAVVFRREFLDATGGFDERYFLYYEDVDLGRRGARANWRYRCVPASVVEHRKGASTRALGERTVYLRERNRLWSAIRNEPLRTVVGALWLSIRRLRKRPYNVHAKALAAGLAGGPTRLSRRLLESRPVSAS
jgi:GT2 family glycosyltransferase